MLVFTCAKCNSQLQIDDRYAGKAVACPNCAHVNTAPVSVAAIEPAPAAPIPTAQKTSRDRDEEEPQPRRRRRSRNDDDLEEVRRRPSSGGNYGWIVAVVVGVVCMCVVCPCLIALIVPAVQKVREAAARTQNQNNMKQIALAAINYHDTYKNFPAPAIKNQQGQAVDLSWRVAILPFLEQQNLFRQFDVNSDWNSPQNIALTNMMPNVYRSPESRHMHDAPDQTRLQYLTGPNTLFPTKTTAPKMHEITDGLSNTILFAEAANPVTWSKAADMNVTAQGPLPLGNGKIHISLGDGSVRTIDRGNVPEATLRSLIDPKDGAVIPGGWDR